MVSLAPFDPDRLAGWLDDEDSAYVDDRVAAGDDRGTAERIAAQQRDRLFPGGRPAPDQHVFAIVDDSRPVGTLWIGTVFDGPPEHWWVWSIEVDEGHRGRGVGSAAMRLAEVEARQRGATQIGLNVFGHNTGARRLYRRLGYDETSIQMRKALPTDAEGSTRPPR
jgi:ribosomal protein S18 acetylase RimI-like enzyme